MGAFNHLRKVEPLGSFVRLNSGGPIGIVTELTGGLYVGVTWLTGCRSHKRLPIMCLSRACQPREGERF